MELLDLAGTERIAYNNTSVSAPFLARRSTMIDGNRPRAPTDGIAVSASAAGTTATPGGSSLRVSTDGVAGPYLMVPVTQLDAVLAVLDRNHVRYWVDADAISLDNEPAITVINFGRSGDAARIQTILDEAA
jgi:hypothetical protein